jgi:hypothetical protein
MKWKTTAYLSNLTVGIVGQNSLFFVVVGFHPPLPFGSLSVVLNAVRCALSLSLLMPAHPIG